MTNTGLNLCQTITNNQWWGLPAAVCTLSNGRITCAVYSEYEAYFVCSLNTDVTWGSTCNDFLTMLIITNVHSWQVTKQHIARYTVECRKPSIVQPECPVHPFPCQTAPAVCWVNTVKTCAVDAVTFATSFAECKIEECKSALRDLSASAS